MLQTLLNSIMDTAITPAVFFGATGCSMLLGLFIALAYSQINQYSRSFLLTLALVPAIVQIIIMMVNGNIGAGVAVAGAFSLVRFRSAPGSGEEITSIFLAMAVGLATGMGYLGIAVVFTILVILFHLLLCKVGFGPRGAEQRTIRVEVPESLDYEGVFDDIFARYTDKADLVEVRTAGMGSLYRLQYETQIKPGVSLKSMMDEMRMRNGNLEIRCTKVADREGL